MMSLTEIEAFVLRDALTPDTADSPDSSPEEDARHRLVARGLIVLRDHAFDPDCFGIDITPLGRVALDCYVAARVTVTR